MPPTSPSQQKSPLWEKEEEEEKNLFINPTAAAAAANVSSSQSTKKAWEDATLITPGGASGEESKIL